MGRPADGSFGSDEFAQSATLFFSACQLNCQVTNFHSLLPLVASTRCIHPLCSFVVCTRCLPSFAALANHPTSKPFLQVDEAYGTEDAESFISSYPKAKQWSQRTNFAKVDHLLKESEPVDVAIQKLRLTKSAAEVTSSPSMHSPFVAGVSRAVTAFLLAPHRRTSEHHNKQNHQNLEQTNKQEIKELCAFLRR